MAKAKIDGQEYQILSLTYEEAESMLKQECDRDNGPGTWDSMEEGTQKILCKVFSIGYREGITKVITEGGGQVKIGMFSTTSKVQ